MNLKKDDFQVPHFTLSNFHVKILLNVFLQFANSFTATIYKIISNYNY